MGPPDKKIDLTVPDPIVGEQGPVYEDLLTVQALVNAIDITNPIQTLKNFAGLLVDEVKNIAEAVKDLDEESSRLVRSLGVSKDRAGELSSTVARAIPRFVDMGMGIDAAGDTYNELIKNLDTNMMVSDKTLADFAATSKVTGVAQKDLAVKFRDVGVGLSSVGDKMLDVVKVARQAGATVGAVSDGVVSNLDKMNLYNFDGGIKGLAKMAAQASRLGFEMSGIFSIVTKVFDPEGAIEFAASLQRLGVTSSQLLDPLRLMDLAQNDPTELQNQIVNMTKEFTRFNKENNQIEILPGAKRRIDEIGKAMGLPAGELQKMAINAGMFEMKLKQIKFPTDIANKEDRELIATMAQIGKDGKASVRMELTRTGKDGKEEGTGEYIDKLVSELNTDDVAKLAQQQKSNDASMEDIAKDQLTYLKRIESSMNTFVGAAKYGIASSNTLQGGYKGGLNFFQKMLDEQIPQKGKKSENYRTGTDYVVNEVSELIKTLGIGDMFKDFKEMTTTYFEELKTSIPTIFGMGGSNTDNQTLIQSLNNPNLNISNEPMTITTENQFTVDFNVIADDKISTQSIQDINSAISNYFNGPDGTKNMQGLLSRIDNIRVSNGQKPIFK